MDKFEVTIVRVGGQIDINATITEVSDRLSKLATSERANLDEIAAKVEEVFDEHPGMKSFQLGVLAAYTMNKLSVPPTEFEEIQERVKDYVRNSVDIFHIAKGKGGGAILLSRLDEKEMAKVIEQRAKESQKANVRETANSAVA